MTISLPRFSLMNWQKSRDGMMPWKTLVISMKNKWSHRLTGIGHHPFKVEIGVRASVGSPDGKPPGEKEPEIGKKKNNLMIRKYRGEAFA